MNEYLLLKFAHILALVYWLGGDLGTFIASNYVIKRDIDPTARHVALKIMLACDQGPKLAMPLVFPLGFHMASITGLVTTPSWSVGLVWLLGVYWFTTVLVLYLNEGKAFTSALSKLDLYFRIAVIIGLGLFALAGLKEGELITADWLAWKILIFAIMIGCGVFIRIHLKPFVPAFAQMMQSGASEATDEAMSNSVAHCRPFVWAIWLGLFVNTALGIHLI